MRRGHVHVNVEVGGVSVHANVARRAFYIVNEHSGHVLEIQAGLTAIGTHLEQGHRRPDKAMYQLWHIDPITGLIHSMIDDLVLECKSIGDRVTIGRPCSAPFQAWCIEGRTIRNRLFPSECLEVRRGERHAGADVVLNRYEGHHWQHWFLEYI